MRFLGGEAPGSRALGSRTLHVALMALFAALISAFIIFTTVAWSQTAGDADAARSETTSGGGTVGEETSKGIDENEATDEVGATSEEATTLADRDPASTSSTLSAEEKQMVSAALKAVGEGDLVGNEVTERDVNPDAQDNIDRVDIDATDCVVDNDAVIVFEDGNGDRLTVVNRENVNIDATNEQVVVTARPFDDEINFIVSGSDNTRRVTVELEVVSSLGIECAGDGGNGGTNNPGTDNPGTDTDADTDGDGVLDTTDNCDNTDNADQADADSDGIGDACETTTTPTADTTTDDATDTANAEGTTADLAAVSCSELFSFLRTSSAAQYQYRGNVISQYLDDDVLSQRLVDCRSAAVIQGTVPDGNLPNTGGMSPLLWGLWLALLVSVSVAAAYRIVGQRGR